MKATGYWLMKSEPDVYSIEALERDGTTSWEGVRNYQARNFLRDDFKVGDGVLFYHSSCEPPGVAGLARVSRAGHPDPSALDAQSPYFDAKSRPEAPVWITVEVAFVARFARLVSLDELRGTEGLTGLLVLKRGMRLSVQPVTQREYEIVKKMGLGTRLKGGPPPFSSGK